MSGQVSRRTYEQRRYTEQGEFIRARKRARSWGRKFLRQEAGL
ncbi:MAG: hypothetical protein WC683_05170 [bacterium]